MVNQPLTLDDFKHAYAAVAHDAAGTGEQIAQALPEFATLADYQKTGVIALTTAKVVLLALERAGLTTHDQVNTDAIREALRNMKMEVLNG
jgi:hypothetical protein